MEFSLPCLVASKVDFCWHFDDALWTIFHDFPIEKFLVF